MHSEDSSVRVHRASASRRSVHTFDSSPTQAQHTVLVAILVVLLGMRTAMKGGFKEAIKGLEVVSDRLNRVRAD